MFSHLSFRNTHAHGSHYNPIMQQPALLTGHVTLPAAQPLNVGVAHVMRQQPTSTTSSRKSKQHQSSARWVVRKLSVSGAIACAPAPGLAPGVAGDTGTTWPALVCAGVGPPGTPCGPGSGSSARALSDSAPFHFSGKHSGPPLKLHFGNHNFSLKCAFFFSPWKPKVRNLSYLAALV